MVATLGVLFVGIISFARGGKFNAEHSNRLMRMRVLVQGIAVALLGLMMLFAAS